MLKRSGHSLLFVLLSFLLLQSNGKPATEWVRQQLDIYKETHKLWFGYMRSFLKHHIDQLDYHTIIVLQMQGYLSNFLSFVNIFRTHNSSALLLNSLKSSLSKYLHFLQDTGQFLSNKDTMTFSHILQNASGNFLLNSDLQPSAHPLYQYFCSDGFIMKDDCLKITDFEFSLYFFLSSHLTVNITFDEVQFKSGSINFIGGHVTCDLGQLLVVSWLGRLVPSSPLSEQLSFCGHLSKTSVHPKFQSAFIQTGLYPSVTLHVQGHFVIQDEYLQIFTHQYGIKHSVVRDTISYTFQKKYTLSVFRIEMSKLKKIVIQQYGNSTTLLVHNGPGPKSPVIQPLHNAYILTSFQAFVAHLQPDWLSGNSLSFASLNVTTAHIMHHNHMEIYLPYEKFCLESLCVLSFHSREKHQINLTVLSIYTGEKTAKCAGMVDLQQPNILLGNTLKILFSVSPFLLTQVKAKAFTVHMAFCWLFFTSFCHTVI